MGTDGDASGGVAQGKAVAMVVESSTCEGEMPSGGRKRAWEALTCGGDVPGGCDWDEAGL